MSTASPIVPATARASTDAQGRAIAPPRRRSVAVDNGKAIGIVLVVVGHAPAIAPLLSDAIFAFHMPFFFLLSGMLVSPERLSMPFVTRVRSLARSLLVPYLFFFVVAWLYWLVAKRHGLRAGDFAAVAWWQPWEGLIGGTGDALYVDPALWFFPCLFVTATLHHAVRRALSARTAALALLAVAFVVTTSRPSDWPPLPWSVDCALVASAFYAGGAWWHARPDRYDPGVGVALRVAVAAIGLATCLAALPLIGHVDLSHLAFGNRPVFYLPVAASGSLAILALASLLPASRMTRWLSDNTLVIFPLHMLIFSIVTGIGVLVLRDGGAFKESSGWVAVVYVATALALCGPASVVLRRSVPWLFASGSVAAARTPTEVK